MLTIEKRVLGDDIGLVEISAYACNQARDKEIQDILNFIEIKILKLDENFYLKIDKNKKYEKYLQLKINKTFESFSLKGR